MTKQLTSALYKLSNFTIAATVGITASFFPTAALQAETIPSWIYDTGKIPARITIAAAKVSADIIPVGVTPTGNLDTPHNFVQAGWYKYGTKPGQVGSAVIDGHVDNGASIPGPFKRLDKVRVGDDIAIDASDGSVLHFTVLSSDVYKTSAFPSDSIFNDHRAPLLKIITCHGRFIASKKTYDERLVVTAYLRTVTANSSSTPLATAQ